MEPLEEQILNFAEMYCEYSEEMEDELTKILEKVRELEVKIKKLK
jgi:hypothetical protein